MVENDLLNQKKVIVSPAVSKGISELRVAPVVNPNEEAGSRVNANSGVVETNSSGIVVGNNVSGVAPTEKSKELGVVSKPQPKRRDSTAIVLDLISPNKSIDLKIKEILGEESESFVIIMTLSRAQHELRYLRLVKYFVDKGIPGVYLTINKSTAELLEQMGEQKIDTKNIFFVDAVTKMTEGAELEEGKAAYIESQDDITEITLEMDNAISRLSKGKGFVIVDSITTLVVYNKAVIVEKFLHALSQKIKALELKGVFLAAESTDKETLDIISQFCDDIKNF